MKKLPALFWYLWTGTLITRAGALVLPFLTVYLVEERGLEIWRAGLIVSLFGIGSILAGPVSGWLTDRVGRRFTLLAALFGTAAVTLALAYSRSLPALIAATIALGFATDLIRPAIAAAIADVVPPEDRVRAFGLLHWAMNIGFSIAPFAGGFLAARSFFWLFVVDAITTFVYGVIVFFRVRDVRQTFPSVDAQTGMSAPHRYGRVYRDPVMLAFCGLVLLVGAIFFQFNTTLAVEMTRRGLSKQQYGSVLAVNGILIVILQPIAARFLGRFRRPETLAAGSLLVGGGFALSALCKTPLQFALTVIVWTLGEIVITPVASAVVADLAPADARGEYQGLFFATWGVAIFLGTSVGSLIMDRFGSGALWLTCLAAGTTAAIGHLVLGNARRRVAQPAA